MEEKVQPTQEFDEVNKLRKKSQLKNERKKEKLGLLPRKMFMKQELCIFMGSFPRTTHADFIAEKICSPLIKLFICLLFL